ncbi:MAG: hypothetical protein ACC682_14435 [Gemmatimonadota bacterium]
MSRLLAEMALDVRLQVRNRLYTIGVTVAVLLGLAGRYAFPSEALEVVLPAFFLLFLGGSTYMFVAAMIMLERGDRTLEAVRITPLRLGEYMTSKVVTLTAFTVLESAIIVIIAWGVRDIAVLPLVVGIALLGAINTLLGVAQVAKHETVTDFLVPGAMIVSLVLTLPLFHLLGMWTSPLWYLIPTRAPLALITAAFGPIATGEWIYGVAYGGLWLLIAFLLARRQFTRHVVLGGR